MVITNRLSKLKSDASFVSAIATFAVLKAIIQLQHIDLRVANYAVSSPLNYIWLSLNPEMAEHDWPAGAADFRFSMPMRVLRWLVEQFQFSPELILWPFGFVQIFLLMCSIAYLVHTIFSNKAVTLASIAVISISPIAGVNFGNFGAGIGNQTPVLFYSLANAFKFFALACFLRKRYFQCGVLLLAATYTHVALGTFMIYFIAAASLAYLRDSFVHRFVMLLVVSIGLIPLILLLFSDSNLSTSSIPVEQWLLMSKLFNWHWHTVSHGMFGPLGQFIALPFIFLLLGCLLFFVRKNFKLEKNEIALLFGALASLVLGITGLFFSEWYPVPAIMKISPQRATELSSFVFLVFFLAYLIESLNKATPFKLLLVIYQTLLLTVSKFGAALIIPLIFLKIEVRNRATLVKVISISLLAGLVSLAIFELYIACGFSICSKSAAHANSSLVKMLWTPLQHLSPFESGNYFLSGGGLLYPSLGRLVVFIVVISLYIRFATSRRDIREFAFIGMLMLTALGASHLREANWYEANGEKASDYIAVQRWAKSDTPKGAIFIGDPSRATGWREFSARAYYGSISELAHFATLYDSRPERFDAGLDRLRAFGVDPLLVDTNEVANFHGKYGISVLGPQIRDNFYAATPTALKSVAAKYSISYLIYENSLINAEPNHLALAYKNTHFTVYKLD